MRSDGRDFAKRGDKRSPAYVALVPKDPNRIWKCSAGTRATLMAASSSAASSPDRYHLGGRRTGLSMDAARRARAVRPHAEPYDWRAMKGSVHCRIPSKYSRVKFADVHSLPLMNRIFLVIALPKWDTQPIHLPGTPSPTQTAFQS